MANRGRLVPRASTDAFGRATRSTSRSSDPAPPAASSRRSSSTAGYSVVVLEQGPRLTEAQFITTSSARSCRTSNANNPATQPQTFRATPQRHGPERRWRSSTVEWSAAATRISPPTSGGCARAISTRRAVLGGVPGTALVDWPITYDELEPYYTKAEWELGVSGEPGPFDPPRSRPYPMPPLPVKSSGVLMDRGARALGLHSAAVADGDQLAALQRAARVPALRLLPVLHVRVPREVDVDGDHAAARGSDRPLRDPAGQLRGARRDRTATAGRPASRTSTRRSGCSCSAPGRSCSARTAPRRRGCCSTPSRRGFPNGLANSSGVVGKHLMFNTYFGVNAQFEHPLNEYKSVQNTPHRARLLRHGSAARILRRRRHRRALRQVSDHFSRSAACRRDRRPGAKASPAASPSSSRGRCSSATHGTSLPRRIEQRHDRSRRSRTPGGCRACASPTRIIRTI